MGKSVRNFPYALFTTRVFSSNVALFQSCFMFALKILDPVLFRAKYIYPQPWGGVGGGVDRGVRKNFPLKTN